MGKCPCMASYPLPKGKVKIYAPFKNKNCIMWGQNFNRDTSYFSWRLPGLEIALAHPPYSMPLKMCL